VPFVVKKALSNQYWLDHMGSGEFPDCDGKIVPKNDFARRILCNHTKTLGRIAKFAKKTILL